MDHDGGWVELLGTDASARARAHLLVSEPPLATDSWHGRLESLRYAEGIGALEPGDYVLRFEDGGERRLVRLAVSDHGAEVSGTDGLLPPTLLELAEGF